MTLLRRLGGCITVFTTSYLLLLRVHSVSSFALNRRLSHLRTRIQLAARTDNILMIDAKNQQDNDRAPFVFCVGTAQTAKIWENFASQWGRRVLLFQPIGLGSGLLETDDRYPDLSVRSQVELLLEAIDAAFGDEEVDLGGFSLGGRIALAAACDRQFRKLHITGVGLERSADGLTEIQSWRDRLEAGDMEAFARAALQVSYAKQPDDDKLPFLIESIVSSQTANGLLRLLNEAHDEEGPYSVKGIAGRLSHSQGALVVGEFDNVLAPRQEVEALSRHLGWSCPETILGAGHSVPFEASRAWRQHLTRFLDDKN